MGKIDTFNIPLPNDGSRTSEVNFLLKMDVTPHITADNSIKLDINIQNKGLLK